MGREDGVSVGLWWCIMRKKRCGGVWGLEGARAEKGERGQKGMKGFVGCGLWGPEDMRLQGARWQKRSAGMY